MAKHYRCAECSGLYPSKSVAVDHRDPVVDPKTGFVSWDVYIERLFCEAENLQTLCTACHAAKTKLEREQAKEWREPTNTPVPKTRKKDS